MHSAGSATSGANAPRIHALDGLRGWAALFVCLFHVFVDAFRGVVPELGSPFIALVLNGQFPIALFFVLSGYVLTVNCWRRPKVFTLRQMVKRYPRLFIPIAVTVAIVFLLMVFGLARHAEALPAFAAPWWMRGTIFEPSVIGALGFATIWAFVGTAFDQNYHPFLWTMFYELIGSLLVLLFCLFERGGRLIYVFLGVATVAFLLLFPMMSGFFLGALMALLKADDRLPDIGRWVLPAVIVAVLARGVAQNAQVDVIAAGVVIAAALSGGMFRRALESSASQWLGRLSFPLYLVQWPVIITVTCSLGLMALPLTLSSALLIGLVSIVAILAAAWAFSPVERFTVRFCAWLARFVPDGAASDTARAEAKQT